ncbi:histidine kinase [Paenibacillus sp. PR3]|uniref:histidine kinase n=1 Tax=Paenibacillus terricola TaxID=2763503 RepID=A0ABR8N100_9BACL|nr:ATP-binding protein [Paenibacillus terricola]MBD3920931.1 histidine kinase [Paenibacillus terricola]
MLRGKDRRKGSLHNDVIKRTRWRLTAQYSALLLLFLGLFAAAAYSLFQQSARSERENKLNALLDDELRFVQENYGNMRANQFNDKKDNSFEIGADQAFYYWVDQQGSLVLGNESQSGIRSQALRALEGWGARDDKPRKVKLETQSRLFFRDHDGQQEERTSFLVASRELTAAGRNIGTLYVGVDISAQEEMLRTAALVLGGLTLLFAVACVFVSHLMSKRAMIPIAQSLARQREFVADASHELRTPLSVLMSSIETLGMRRQAAPNENEDEDRFETRTLGYMKDEVKGMTRLVGDLLYLARSDSGAEQLQLTQFDLRASAERTLHGLAPLFEAKQILHDLDAPDKLLVYGDEQRLLQLLVILVDNAVKYSPSGTLVRVKLAEEKQRGHRVLAIAVIDQGIGIPAEEQEKIFERFYREDKTRSRHLGGHGLGLAIAKRIAAACGGTIQVASRLGQGSAFIVRIPISA